MKNWLNKFLFYLDVNFIQRIFWIVGISNTWDILEEDYNEEFDAYVLKLLDYNDWKFTFDYSLYTVKLRMWDIENENIKEKIKNIDRMEDIGKSKPTKYLTFWIGNYQYNYFTLYFDKFTLFKKYVSNNNDKYKKSIINKLEENQIYHMRPSKYTIFRIHKALQKQMIKENWIGRYHIHPLSLGLGIEDKKVKQ